MLNTAIILAGGAGTRLRPLTNDLPKPLLPLKGKPILQHALENLRTFGVKNIIIPISYQEEKVRNYFGDGSQLGLHITYSIEQEPLGTGGAIKQAAQSLSDPFFLLWGDNLADVKLDEIYTAHQQHSGLITLTLTPREDVEHFGVAKLQQNRIITFVEKPRREDAPSNLINAGIFIVHPDCLKMLPRGKSSFEKDCLEKLAPLGKIGSYIHPGQWFPTDTLEKYKIACLEFQPAFQYSEKKIIIADVDETICETNQVMSAAMAHKINSLISQGWQFVFMSGTDVPELRRMVSSMLQQEHHLLGATGTSYTHVKNGSHKEIYSYSLTAADKQEIMNAFQKTIAHFGLPNLSGKEDQILDRNSQMTLSAIGRAASLERKKTLDPDGKKRQEWIMFMTQFLDASKYDIRIGGTTSIDVTKKGLNKEWGIREFAKHHNITLNSIIYFGDKIYPGGNDYEASRIVDCVAVKNPEDCLQKLQQLFP